MESNEAREQLADLRRLEVSAEREGRRLPVWSFAALAVGAAVALGIVAIGDASAVSIVAAAVAWNAIVWGWTWATSRGRRVQVEAESIVRQTRKGLLLTVAGNVVLGALLYAFGFKPLFVLGGLYIAYLLYIALGDVREHRRRA